jgi:hypothetical protein
MERHLETAQNLARSRERINESCAVELEQFVAATVA